MRKIFILREKNEMKKEKIFERRKGVKFLK